MPNAKASEAVQKKLFAKGGKWEAGGKSTMHTTFPFIYWQSNTITWGDCKDRFNKKHLALHTLADFGLTPEGEPLPTFKDGDAVVCDEQLKQSLNKGLLATTYDAFNEPFTLKRTSEDGFVAENDKGKFTVSNKGIAYDLNGEFVGRVLPLPTYGNLKPGDACPFWVGQRVSSEDEQGEVSRLFDGPGIQVEWDSYPGAVLNHGWIKDQKFILGCDINTIFPTEQAKPAPLTMEDIEVGGEYAAVGHINLAEGTVLKVTKKSEKSDRFWCEGRTGYFEPKEITRLPVSHRVDKPVQSETFETLAARKARFEFGDKVRSDNGNIWWVIGGHLGVTFIVGKKRAFDSIAKGVEHEDSEDVQVIETTRLTPWPTPTTFPLTPTIPAIAENGTITFGGTTLTVEQLENALAEAKKSQA